MNSISRMAVAIPQSAFYFMWRGARPLREAGGRVLTGSQKVMATRLPSCDQPPDGRPCRLGAALLRLKSANHVASRRARS